MDNPDRVDPFSAILARKSEVAYQQVESFLASRGSAFEAIEVRDGDRFKAKDIRKAWKTSIVVAGSAIDVFVLLDCWAPFSKPILSLVDDSLFLKIPHVEADGSLCLLEDHSTFSIDSTDVLLESLFQRAGDLLSKSLSGENKQDFINEFHNYWSRVASKDRKDGAAAFTAYSLIKPSGPSRKILSSQHQGSPLFADSIESLSMWIRNKSGKNLEDDTVKESVLLWINSLFFPDQYPSKNMDIATIAKGIDQESYRLLVDILPREPGSFPILLGFHTENGPALAAVRLTEPKTVTIAGKTRNTRFNGFRPASMSDEVLASKYFIASKAEKGIVQRVDGEWVHARGGDEKLLKLLGKSVTLIGCGSLGSYIAMLLAQSGVGKLNIIDPELFSFDNVGRHLLSTEDIGKSKSEKTAEKIKAKLPHLNVTGTHKKWEDIGPRSPEFTEADLLLSTMGDWKSESALNMAVRKSPRCSPIVFGWTEAFACAGHALAVLDIGGCLACGMDQIGQFQFPVSINKAGSLLNRLPACGQFFQPYGVVELTLIHNLVSRMAIDLLLGRITKSQHRVYISSEEYLAENGVVLNPGWEELRTAVSNRNNRIVRDWKINVSCPLCGQ